MASTTRERFELGLVRELHVALEVLADGEGRAAPLERVGQADHHPRQGARAARLRFGRSHRFGERALRVGSVEDGLHRSEGIEETEATEAQPVHPVALDVSGVADVGDEQRAERRACPFDEAPICVLVDLFGFAVRFDERQQLAEPVGPFAQIRVERTRSHAQGTQLRRVEPAHVSPDPRSARATSIFWTSVVPS